MFYVFDIFQQKGEFPSNNDLWLSSKHCDYFTIANEVEWLNEHNDGYFYFIRRTTSGTTVTEGV